MGSIYVWLKFIHVAAALTFLFFHGISGGASLLVEHHRDLSTRRLLLESSYAAQRYSTLALMALLLSGIVLGFYGGWWSRGWIWAALVVFLAVSAGMSYFTLRFDAARKAAGLAFRAPKGLTRLSPIEPDPAALERQIPRLRSRDLAIGGTVGLAIILWLMVFKPF